jgi:hypothetical protein
MLGPNPSTRTSLPDGMLVSPRLEVVSESGARDQSGFVGRSPKSHRHQKAAIGSRQIDLSDERHLAVRGSFESTLQPSQVFEVSPAIGDRIDISCRGAAPRHSAGNRQKVTGPLCQEHGCSFMATDPRRVRLSAVFQVRVQECEEAKGPSARTFAVEARVLQYCVTPGMAEDRFCDPITMAPACAADLKPRHALGKPFDFMAHIVDLVRVETVVVSSRSMTFAIRRLPSSPTTRPRQRATRPRARRLIRCGRRFAL